MKKKLLLMLPSLTMLAAGCGREETPEDVDLPADPIVLVTPTREYGESTGDPLVPGKVYFKR